MSLRTKGLKKNRVTASCRINRKGNGSSGHPSRPPFVPRARIKKYQSAFAAAFSRAFPMHDLSNLSATNMESILVDAHSQQDAAAFKRRYLDANVFKRFQATDPEQANLRVDAALEKLQDSEFSCRVSNRVFAGGLDRSNAHIPPDILRLLRTARAIIHRILGPFDIEELPRSCGFGPGATTEFSRKEALQHQKWARAAHCTVRAVPYVTAFCAWSGFPDLARELTVREANHVFTVPKNFDRDRVAMKPVSWNSFFQKGLGRMIRRRLRRIGLLLPDAQELHRVLVKVASMIPGLATRDLVSASDCEALSLIEVLLPPRWFEVILDLREAAGIYPDGSWTLWEKVSAMGNGFTFELETLVFYALVRAACSEESLVSVYGDDIICPAVHLDRVDYLLSFCGLKVNASKSFGLESKFRESCGGHYFDGVDVKPFYVTRLPATIGDAINLHNDIVRWSGGPPGPDHFLYDLWRLCRSVVPRVYWGPCPNQGSLWADWDECRPTYVPEYQAFRVGAVAYIPEDEDLFIRNVIEDGQWVSTDRNYLGAYFYKLWVTSLDDDDSLVTSHYRSMTDRETRVWSYVDRAQWTALRRCCFA